MIKHGNLPSVMKRHFSEVPQADIQRSSFNRSHGLKTAFNSSSLIPIFWDEALPGDTLNLKMSHFARLSTPIVPFMDNVRLETFFFAVPYRLVWQNWEKFNGQQDEPGASTDYLTPQMTTPPGGSFAEHSLMDYFGIPTKIQNLSVNAFPLYSLLQDLYCIVLLMYSLDCLHLFLSCILIRSLLFFR